MTDRPILFSAPMVRALLAGTKTQTRRDLTKTFARFPHLVGYEADGTLKQLDGKRVPHVEFVHSLLGLWHSEDNPQGRSGWYVPLKVAVGDRLWVRETWAALTSLTHNDPGPQAIIDGGFYRADGGTVDGEISKWKPSIFMPRHASRLTLTVTDVRVERLQDISRGDSIAEGLVKDRSAPTVAIDAGCDWGFEGDRRYGSPISAYAALWDHINGEGAWQKNPWIAAYTFTVERRNIDQIARAA
jgi:hypothetical protein